MLSNGSHSAFHFRVMRRTRLSVVRETEDVWSRVLRLSLQRANKLLVRLICGCYANPSVAGPNASCKSLFGTFNCLSGAVPHGGES